MTNVFDRKQMMRYIVEQLENADNAQLAAASDALSFTPNDHVDYDSATGLFAVPTKPVRPRQ